MEDGVYLLLEQGLQRGRRVVGPQELGIGESLRGIDIARVPSDRPDRLPALQRVIVRDPGAGQHRPGGRVHHPKSAVGHDLGALERDCAKCEIDLPGIDEWNSVWIGGLDDFQVDPQRLRHLTPPSGSCRLTSYLAARPQRMSSTRAIRGSLSSRRSFSPAGVTIPLRPYLIGRTWESDRSAARR